MMARNLMMMMVMLMMGWRRMRTRVATCNLHKTGMAQMTHPMRLCRFSTEAHVRKLCEEGRLSMALEAALMMQHQGCTISQDTVRRLLQVCITKKDLAAGRQVQSLMLKSGLQSVSLLGDHLIRLFASCGSLIDANKAFYKIREATVYTWNAIISAHVQLGDAKKALGLYCKMEEVGVTPDIVTFLCVLKACAGVGALEQGRRTHDQVIRHELDSSACSNSLIDMYAKCGSLEEAHRVFVGLSSRSIVSWGALMAGYVENGDACSTFGLFKQMKENGVEPNRAIFLCIIKACICIGDVGQGRLVHFEIIQSGFDLELMVGNALMDLYVKFSCLEDALRVFDKLPRPDVVSWDIRIAGLAENGSSFSALESYEIMQSKGLKPDKYTYSCILKACAIEGVVCQGKLVHDQILRCGLESNVVVANTLIDMYGKCACIGEACEVFHGLASPDVVSWGTVIARCVQHGFDGLALDFFERMHQDVPYPSKAVFLCALKACASAGTLVLGRRLHDQMIRGGLEIDLTSGSTLVNMYGSLGSLEEAGIVFNSMKDRNEVTWGLMIAGHIQHNYFLSAVGLFARMQREGMRPDKASFVGMLKGCSKSGAIIYGRLLHEQIIESGLAEDVEVRSALIDMYAKCGNSKDSLIVLEGFPGRNVALWGAQIASFAWNGCFQAARECLNAMDRQGFKPDHVVFVSLLSACTCAGLLEEGCWFFSSMRNDYGIEPGIEEYNSIVDLLGRAGLTREAEDLLLSMPCSPDVLGWMSLLSCCRTFFNRELARRCFDQIVQLDPNDASGFVLMASIDAEANIMWDNSMDINGQVQQADPSKKPGVTCTEVGQGIHEFSSCFPEKGDLYVNASW